MQSLLPSHERRRSAVSLGKRVVAGTAIRTHIPKVRAEAEHPGEARSAGKAERLCRRDADSRLPFTGHSSLSRRIAREPSLYEHHSDNDVERYRFLWLRTFHKPIAVRIEKNAGGFTGRVVRLSGQGGYEPGQIERDEQFAVTTQQWNEFTDLLQRSSFWQMPTDEDEDEPGLDGAQWILEGQHAGKYHVVDRWTPIREESRNTDSFVACCRCLLTLAHEQVPQGEEY